MTALLPTFLVLLAGFPAGGTLPLGGLPAGGTVPLWGLPSLLVLLAGCLILPLGALVASRRIWGPASIFVLAAAAACLWWWGPVEMPVAAGASPLMAQDRMAIGFQWVCLALGVLLTLIAFDAQRQRETSSEHFGLLLVALAGAMFVGMANDLVVLYVALELVALPITLLLLLGADGAIPWEAAGKHFLLGLLASGLLLCGFALLYGLAGTTSLPGIRSVLAGSYTPGAGLDAIGSPSRLGIVALVLIVAGLGFRTSTVPFHFHAPDLFQGASMWNAGVLALLPKACGLVALARVLAGTLAGYHETAGLLLTVLAALTMLAGSVMTAVQSQLKPFLAWLTVTCGGFLLVGIAAGLHEFAAPEHVLRAGSGFPGGVQAMLFDLCGYLLAGAGLFAILVYLGRSERPLEYIDDLTGWGRDQPLPAVAVLVFLLSLAGVPPLPGFWGRLAILAAALDVHQESWSSGLYLPHPGLAALACVMALSTLILTVACLRVAAVLFFESPVARPNPSGGQSALAAGIIALLLTIGLGVLPGPLLSYWSQTR